MIRSVLIEKETIDPRGCSYSFPWRHDSICFNFDMPNELIIADNTDNIDNPADITTVVIGCDLPDYGFLSVMKNLKQLYVYSGKNLKDLEFIENLTRLRQLYIADSKITDISSLLKLIEKKNKLIQAIGSVSDENAFFRRLEYSIEGVCIQSDSNIKGIEDIKRAGRNMTEVLINGRHIV